MATIKQKRAFKEITEKHRSVSGAMREVGYAKSSTTKPSNLTNSKGFQELCEECGLTDKFLTDALVEDIKKKKRNRKPELELGFKLRNRLKDNLDLTSNGRPLAQVFVYLPKRGSIKQD